MQRLGVHVTDVQRQRQFVCRATDSSDRHLDQAQVASSSTDSKGSTIPYRLLLGLAAGGILETSYLTLTKLLAAPVACPLSGSCDTVLSSGYAELFGIPLSAFGLAAYSAVATLAFTGLQGLLPEDTARVGLLAGGTVLASTSSFLLYTLVTQFPGDNCVWCLTSAALSFGILISSARAFRLRDAKEVAGPSLALAGIVLGFLSLYFSDVETSQAFDLPYAQPTVTKESSPRAVELAKRLKESGAKMYGAFWCTHCFDQKQDFGRDAMADFPYVECYPDGVHAGGKLAEACTAAGLQSFPTWIIDGQKLEGEQSLDKLEALLPPQ